MNQRYSLAGGIVCDGGWAKELRGRRQCSTRSYECSHTFLLAANCIHINTHSDIHKSLSYIYYYYIHTHIHLRACESLPPCPMYRPTVTGGQVTRLTSSLHAHECFMYGQPSALQQIVELPTVTRQIHARGRKKIIHLENKHFRLGY